MDARLSQRPAAQAVAAGAPLEELQAAVVPLAVARAHLPLLQHGLADVAPEVAGAAQAGGAVGRAEAGPAHLTCKDFSVSLASKTHTTKRIKAAFT